jgi:hypothetical protein
MFTSMLYCPLTSPASLRTTLLYKLDKALVAFPILMVFVELKGFDNDHNTEDQQCDVKQRTRHGWHVI